MSGAERPDVDLFVIGAGSGGVRAARIAAGHGARVMIAEEFRTGGTCVIRGCVPKKLYVYAGRFKDEFAAAPAFGWTIPKPPTFDWPTLVRAKEAEITRLSGVYNSNLEKSGVVFAQGRATVTGPHTVALSDGRTVSAGVILVATGASPTRPRIPGIEHAITSNEIFDMADFPRRLLIVGGGYVGVEFAGVFANLGSRVTHVLRGANVLRGFDEDMRCGVRDALAHAGVTFGFGATPVAIDKTADGLVVSLSDETRVTVDQVLMATGRAPHTKGLGLDSAGVTLDKLGAIEVDGFSQTSAPSIYAVGDVTNRLNLTPVAIREGHAFADTVFGGKPTRVDHHDVATAVFSTPELGTVGLSEDDARMTHPIVDVYFASFRSIKASLSHNPNKTLMKIVVDGQTDRVIGVHILGHDAGEMAQLLGISVKMGVKKADFDATMAVHPTAAEELVTMRQRTRRHERLEEATMPGLSVSGG